MARASFFVAAAPSAVPTGPTRLNRNGGATSAASAFGAAAVGVSDSETGSASSPVRPPTWVTSSPSPSMKKVSDPCFIRASDMRASPLWWTQAWHRPCGR